MTRPTNLRPKYQAQLIPQVRLLTRLVVALFVAAAAQSGSVDPRFADPGIRSSSSGFIKGSFEYARVA
jgi:hypothetical protein